MEIYRKLQQVRVEIGKLNLKKTGENLYSHFKYWQLEDFIFQANEEFNKVGLCPVFSINVPYTVYKDDGSRRIQEKCATLKIYDSETGEYVVFESPLADVIMGKQDKVNPIQQLGAMHTYLKRYLYLNALELAENDEINEAINRPTQEEIVEFEAKYSLDEQKRIRNHYQVKNNDELSQEIIQLYIKNRKEKLKKKILEVDESTGEVNEVDSAK